MIESLESAPGPQPSGDDAGFDLGVSTRRVVDDAALRLAVRLIDSSGVVDLFEGWKSEERRGPGGRPATFPMRALLVGFAVCVLTDQPPLLMSVCDVMFRQMSPEWQARLGIPEPPAPNNVQAWSAVYRNVRTRFHAIEDLIDSSPSPKNRRLDQETFVRRTEENRARRSEEEWDEREQRLVEILNRLLESSFSLLPRDVRRAYKGTVGVDATPVRSFARATKYAKGGRKRDARAVEVYSADPDAGYYTRESDARDDGDGRHGSDKSFWAREATLVVTAPDDPDNPDVPSVALGMAPLHTPGQRPGQHGVVALASVRSRGHPAGYLVADRAYSSAKPEDFQGPVTAMGYQPVYDLKSDQLGVKGGYQGFLFIEGAYYCPSIPKDLINATIDYREHRIDEETYQARIEERRQLRARPKTAPDADGYVRLQCPAAGAKPVARCPLKPKSERKAEGVRVRISPSPELRSHPPACCSQDTITLPPTEGVKFRQPLHFGSTEWHERYRSIRSANEGMNGFVKDPAHEALGEAGRRRVMGRAAQSLIVAFLLMAANVRKILAFRANRLRTSAERPVRRRRRRANPATIWRPKAPAIAAEDRAHPRRAEGPLPPSSAPRAIPARPLAGGFRSR